MRKTRKFRTGDKSRVWRDDVKNETTMLDTFRNTLLRSGLRCELKPDTGPCRAAIPKYYFDQKSN